MADEILTAETFYTADLLARMSPQMRAQIGPGYLAAPPNLRAAALKGRPERPVGQAVAPAVVAYVNRNRWVVDCPLYDPLRMKRCGYAQVTARDDRRFFCAGCRNAAVGYKWLGVQWPDEAERDEVEAALLERPEPKSRNWRGPWAPDESVERLRADNRRLLRRGD